MNMRYNTAEQQAKTSLRYFIARKANIKLLMFLMIIQKMQTIH